MNTRFAAMSGLAVMALVAAPISPASAHGFRHGHCGLFSGIAALGTAAVVGAATVATAPIRVLTAPGYAPAVGYVPPPSYYAAPAPYYSAPAPGYYSPAPGYYYGR